MRVEGLILAAGLPNDKLLLEIAGKTIIKRCIESMIDSVSRIVVVGNENKKIEKIVTSFYHVDYVLNNDNGKDIMVNGLKEINADKVFIIPADYPLVKNKTYELMKQFDNNLVIPTFKGEKGYPILMNRSFIDKCKNQYSVNLFKLQEHKFFEVNDAGILVNIKTIDDYFDIYRRFNN